MTQRNLEPLLLPTPVSYDFFTIPTVAKPLEHLYYAIRRCMIDVCQQQSFVYLDELFEEIVSNEHVINLAYKLNSNSDSPLFFIAKHAKILISELQRLVHEKVTNSCS